jgi:hypothetical protein
MIIKIIYSLNRFIILSLSFVFCQNLMAQNPGKSDNQPATAYKSTRFSLELVKTEPVPVIGPQHSDAQDIPAGFEAGTTVKVTISGKSAYHMVTSTMETFGDTRVVEGDQGSPSTHRRGERPVYLLLLRL